jgi:hypothetical protein
MLYPQANQRSYMRKGCGCPCAIQRRLRNQLPSLFRFKLPRRQACATSTLVLSALRGQNTRGRMRLALVHAHRTGRARAALDAAARARLHSLAQRQLVARTVASKVLTLRTGSNAVRLGAKAGLSGFALGCRYRGRSGRCGRIGKEMNASDVVARFV